MPDLPSPRSTHSGLLLEIAAVALLVVVALGLRVAPIGDLSIWWDELIHVQTALQPGLLEVVKAVKLGIPPGFGNAGAVPLDYMLLHGWLRLTPTPSPDELELHYRLPALLWNVLTVLLLYLYARRFFGRGFAFVAGTILGLSVSHSLYAAEARSYALFALMTVVNLHAFSSLVVGRERIVPWVIYTAVAILYFATGFTALLPMVPQYAILFTLLLADAFRRARRPTAPELARLAFPPLSGGLLLAVVGLYLRGTFLGVRYGRSATGLSLTDRIDTALDFFADGGPVLLTAFVVGLVVLPLSERRRSRESLAIALQLVLSFLAIPVIVELERWKEYYFHPRHAYFLFPAFALVATGGLLGTLRGLDPLARSRLRKRTRSASYVAIAVLVVVAGQIGPISSHLANPNRRFGRTKTLRDFKSLVHHLRERVDHLPPDQVYLLLAERGQQGHIGNPLLAKYLTWYGLEDRVVLRGTDRPLETLAALRRECPDGCVGEPAARVRLRLKALGPFNIATQLLELIGVAPPTHTPAPVGAVGLVYYWRARGGPPRRAAGFDVTFQPGLTLFEKHRRGPDGGRRTGRPRERSARKTEP